MREQDWLYENREILGIVFVCNCGKPKTGLDIVSGEFLFDGSCRNCDGLKGPYHQQALREIAEMTKPREEKEPEITKADQLSSQVVTWIKNRAELMDMVIPCNSCGKPHRLIHYIVGTMQPLTNTCVVACTPETHPNVYAWERYIRCLLH